MSGEDDKTEVLLTAAQYAAAGVEREEVPLGATAVRRLERERDGLAERSAVIEGELVAARKGVAAGDRLAKVVAGLLACEDVPLAAKVRKPLRDEVAVYWRARG